MIERDLERDVIDAVMERADLAHYAGDVELHAALADVAGRLQTERNLRVGMTALLAAIVEARMREQSVAVRFASALTRAIEDSRG